jgi:hypothetical protein|tara:strand:- start:73 stop:258 length:186 start_codon:yes stop_codon:yes gene_type:complete
MAISRGNISKQLTGQMAKQTGMTKPEAEYLLKKGKELNDMEGFEEGGSVHEIKAYNFKGVF